MRLLTDPESGEMVEVAETDILDLTPYDYSEAKRAHHAASKYYFSLVNRFRDAKNAEGEAERNYRRLLAIRVMEKRGEGAAATLAETLAKGDEDVAEAKKQTIIAAGECSAIWHLLELARANFVTISQLTKWSESIDHGTFPEKPVY